MAQGTGQARRRNSGTEKGSGKDSGARASRNGTARRQSSAKSGGGAASKTRASSNGRSSTASKRSTPAKTGRAKSSTARAKTSTAKKKTASAVRHLPDITAPVQAVAEPAKAAVGSVKATARSVRTAAAVVRTAAKPLKALASPLKSTALPAGIAGAGLASAGAARLAKRRRERQPSRLSRAGSSLRAGLHPLSRVKPQLPKRRSGRSRLPHPSLPQLPHLSMDLPEPQHAMWLAAIPVGLEATTLLGRTRRLPIQQCVDVAVPLEVVYDEWMQLDFLPEGAYRVKGIERERDNKLTGRVTGPMGSRRWEAEILDEREDESFAWRSVKGSDCAGLITFHRLGERLTRLELQLDIVPVRAFETAEFLLRVADARARAELRRFKARLETMDPDSYGVEDGGEPDHNDKEG